MKLFEKKKDGNRRNFYFCGKRFLSYKKGKAQPLKIQEAKEKTPFEIYEYIKKYQYVLDKPVETKESVESDYVWQYWGQGEEQAPELVKACFASVKKYCPDKNIIVLNDENVKDYIDIPDFIQDKLQKGIISRTHFSDYLRTCLLAKYGGTWIDATVYLTDSIPQEIENSDFFVFKPLAYSECKKVPSMKMLKLLERIPTYLSPFLCLSSWFIHSKSHNIILEKTKNLMEVYWSKEDSLFDYFLFHYFVTLAVLNDADCKKMYESMPNLANRNPHLLQNVLLDIYDEELFDELKGLSKIHKLTYRKNEGDDYTFVDKITDIAETTARVGGGGNSLVVCSFFNLRRQRRAS